MVLKNAHLFSEINNSCFSGARLGCSLFYCFIYLLAIIFRHNRSNNKKVNKILSLSKDLLIFNSNISLWMILRISTSQNRKY